MRSEGVIDIGHTLARRVVGDLFGRADTADTAAIDLHESDAAIVDRVPRHEDVVRRLAAGKLHRAGLAGERAIGLVGAAMKRLFQPGRLNRLQKRQAGLGGGDVLAPNLPGVDQQNAVRPDPLARRGELVGIILQREAAERTPAAFDRAEAGLSRGAAEFQRLLRAVAEKLRGIGRLGKNVVP